jgi:hypothetical protein
LEYFWCFVSVHNIHVCFSHVDLNSCKLQRILTNDISFQKTRVFKASFLMRLSGECNFLTAFLKIQFCSGSKSIYVPAVAVASWSSFFFFLTFDSYSTGHDFYCFSEIWRSITVPIGLNLSQYNPVKPFTPNCSRPISITSYLCQGPPASLFPRTINRCSNHNEHNRSTYHVYKMADFLRA